MNKTLALVLKAQDDRAALADRHQAFEALVLAFQDMAFACAYAVLGDYQLSKDAAQEAFVSVWLKLSQLRQPEAFPGWLRRILLTQCSRLTRRKRPGVTSLEDLPDLPSVADSPQKWVERGELKNALFAAIGDLPKNERIVVVLFYLNEHSQSDISMFLNVPLTTVAKRLYSARARLRQKMLSPFRGEFMAHRPSRDQSFADLVKAGIYDRYVGQYRFEQRPELVVTIKREGDKLFGEAAGIRNELFAKGRSKTELRTKEFDGRGKFLTNGRGQITHLIYFEFGREMGLAQKIN